MYLASKAEHRRQIALQPDKYEDLVLVFGSNLAGIHGAGAALFAAVKRGFPGHLGVGPAANCYAIPTRDQHIQTLPIHVIKVYVDQFIAFATLMKDADVQFQVTRIGCGHAGYRDEDIAPMFRDAPYNCQFDKAWWRWVDREHQIAEAGNGYAGIVGRTQYWGTFDE